MSRRNKLKAQDAHETVEPVEPIASEDAGDALLYGSAGDADASEDAFDALAFCDDLESLAGEAKAQIAAIASDSAGKSTGRPRERGDSIRSRVLALAQRDCGISNDEILQLTGQKTRGAYREHVKAWALRAGLEFRAEPEGRSWRFFVFEDSDAAREGYETHALQRMRDRVARDREAAQAKEAARKARQQANRKGTGAGATPDVAAMVASASPEMLAQIEAILAARKAQEATAG